MAGTNGVATFTVEGLVEATNANGIKVKGEWLNRSAFGAAIELPAKGAYVRAHVDGRGYLKTLEVIEHTAATPSLSRDRTITRLAVLKAAAQFMGHLGEAREQIKAEHVLAVADKWLTWVEQDV